MVGLPANCHPPCTSVALVTGTRQRFWMSVIPLIDEAKETDTQGLSAPA